jgi:hypothetical protein
MEQRVVTILSKSYPVLYSANAIRRLEKETGHSSHRIGIMLLSGVGGFALLQEVLWAGLEGGRLKNHTRPNPFTVDEVGDLIDEAGGNHVFWHVDEMEIAAGRFSGSATATAVLEAWRSAHPERPRKDVPQGKPDPNVAGPSPEQTSGGPTASTLPSSQE